MKFLFVPGTLFILYWPPGMLLQFPCLTSHLFYGRSGDGTSRIWSIPDDPNQETTSIVLNHTSPDGVVGESRDVTTLEWSVSPH